MRADFANGSAYTTVTNPTPVADGLWHHVATTCDGTTALFYVDGIPGPAVNTQGYFTVNDASPLILGYDLASSCTSYYPERHFNGQMDEVAIYNRALSHSEVAAIYGAGSAGLCLTAGPAITGQPQSQSVVLGGTATFEVATTGLNPINYQWQFNGATLTNNGRISGAQTNLLTITNVQFADAGAYLVGATNVVGGTLSQPATLTVLRKTPVITWTNPASLTYGKALTHTQLTATANVPGSFAYNPPRAPFWTSGPTC